MNQTNQTCPKCQGSRRLPSGRRCYICDGFGSVDDKRMNRYELFEYLDKTRANVVELPPKVTPLGEGIEF